MTQRSLVLPLLVVALAACSGDKAPGTPVTPPPDPVTPPTPSVITVAGRGTATARYNAEVWIHGAYGYTSTWGTRTVGGIGRPGNVIYIWDVRPATPLLVDSLSIPAVGTLGDVQVSSDGRYLVVPSEPGPGYLFTFDLADPVRPRLISTFFTDKSTRGIHTAELQTIGGKLYAFASINTGNGHPARMMIVDLSTPTAPREVWTLDITGSFVHDVFVRDGLLFTAQWNNGMVVHDIGGGGRGGSINAPVLLGGVATAGGKVHNIWWLHDGTNKRFAFIGEEGPATLFTSSSGDIHVVDISNLAAMREVAFLNVPGAGTHNFSVDETNGYLYAAYYNGGVQALDVRGDLSTCAANQRAADGRCDLRLMGRLKAVGLLDQNAPVFIWGVHFTGGSLYASDMINGIWKLAPLTR
ncbi:MAG: hypothetical protein IPK85_23235 [Gemmatimonadetes bacterium]|nr:hypothetical protein [Gemmatimonadota bacterium]